MITKIYYEHFSTPSRGDSQNGLYCESRSRLSTLIVPTRMARGFEVDGTS